MDGVEYLLHQQTLEQANATLQARVDKMRAELEALHKTREKSEKDTHEFVAYFQKEVCRRPCCITGVAAPVRWD